MAKVDAGILQMALIGYEAERQKIENAMAEIQRRLGVPTSHVAISSGEAKPKRKMSAAARKRIAAAQKKRWAAFHESKEKPAAKKAALKKAAPRKKMSAARKAALVANLKKARAARAAKRTAGEAVPF